MFDVQRSTEQRKMIIINSNFWKSSNRKKESEYFHLVNKTVVIIYVFRICWNSLTSHSVYFHERTFPNIVFINFSSKSTAVFPGFA